MASKPVMVKPWRIPDRCAPLQMQDKAAFQQHLLDHMANFEIESPTCPVPLTSVVATLGPSCFDVPETLLAMVEAGMNIVRIDMRLGSIDYQQEALVLARSAVEEYSMANRRIYPLAIAIDLKGPEVLTGELVSESVILKEGEVVTLTTHPRWETCGDETMIFVDYRNLPYILQPKDRVLLDFGRIELYVRGTVDTEIVCEIVSGGELKSHRDVCLVNIPLELDPVTEKDKVDIKFALDNAVDAIFVSRVRNKDAILQIREMLSEKGRGIMLFAKIENRFGFEKFDEILEVSDGIVVNRGMLSIEMSTEKVFQAQKTMFAKCNLAGKPVFVVTEFLNSMVHKSCPTLAEAADVATTVIDGADAIILNDETAFGDRPVLTIRTLVTLCREAESQVWAFDQFTSLNYSAKPPVDPAHAISIAAVEAALKAHAAAILVVTTSGRSAQLMARYRPRCPILAITRYGAVARQLNMWRGVIPIHFISKPLACWSKDVDMRLQYGIEFGKMKEIIKPGDPLLLVNGWRQGAGFTNNIRLVYASLSEPWVYPHSKHKNEKLIEANEIIDDE